MTTPRLAASILAATAALLVAAPTAPAAYRFGWTTESHGVKTRATGCGKAREGVWAWKVRSAGHGATFRFTFRADIHEDGRWRKVRRVRILSAKWPGKQPTKRQRAVALQEMRKQIRRFQFQLEDNVLGIRNGEFEELFPFGLIREVKRCAV